MILIDTGVFSELTKSRPDSRVVDWLFAHRHETLLSTIVIAELGAAIRTTRGAENRRLLTLWLGRLIARHEGRVLPFGTEAAKRWAEFVAELILTGRYSDHHDSQIAAQALVRGVPIATRESWSFEKLGSSLVDPWTA